MSTATGRPEDRDLRARRFRISMAVTSVALVVVTAGAAAWTFVKPLEPEPAKPQGHKQAPPIRLDLMRAPHRRQRDQTEAGVANAAPVVGVDTGQFASESDGRTTRPPAVVDVDGDSPADREVPSDTEVRRELAALERENARIEAALRNSGGAAVGTGQLIWPVRGPITSPFGQRWGRLHAGIDIGVPTGTPVRAADSGRVAISGWVGGYGNYICIEHTRSLTTCYGHNSQLGVRKGESVRKGQVIARAGSTGASSGPHVHFETRVNGTPVNPMRYL